VKPHQNIFFYYRGPRARRENTLFDLQLENNTTKALINLLEHGGPAIMAAFLRLIDPQLATPDTLRRTRVRLQAEASMLSAVNHKWLVTITADQGALDDSQATSTHTRGVPDALVYSLPHFGIIIESKVSASLDEDQLRRHASGAGWTDYKRRDLAWRDIYKSFDGLDRLNERDRLLTNQFRQYLEIVAMAPFTGFTQYDFDFFIGEEEDYRPVLRKKLKEFGEMVYEALPGHIRARYNEGPYLGRVAGGEGRGAWLGLRKVQSPSDPFKHCNFTIELAEAALSFNAVIRDGKATDKRKPIGVLHTRISANAEALTEYLMELGAEFTLKIFSREGLSGSRILPGGENWRLEYVQRLDSVIPETVPMLLGLLHSLRYPGIHLGRELSRGEVLSKSPGELLKEGVTAITRLYPFLRFLEEGHFGESVN
jgi:hypothetical protein